MNRGTIEAHIVETRQLTVLAMGRTDDHVGSASDNGVEWVVVPLGKRSRNKPVSCGAEPI
jgi:hypothetical protein